MNRFLSRLLPLLLGCQVGLPLFSAEPSPLPNSPTPPPESPIKAFEPLIPAPDDGRIAFTTAWMLEHSQFLRRSFNSEMAGQFFDRYLEAYDPERMHFLQSDIAQLEPYRTNLHRLITPRRHPDKADTAPACEIFNRFMERLDQQMSYVEELLEHEQFTFDTDERVALNRKDLPYPKNIEEARKLWRDKLRAEYLAEKLAYVVAQKTADAPAAQEGKAGDAAPKAAAKPKTEREEIVDKLRRRYHRIQRLYHEFNDEDVLGIYLTTLAHVYDPHSDYMTHSQLESFAIAMNLKLEGIGAELRSEDGYCTVNRLLPGPALKSKQIQVNDRIVAVAENHSPPVDLVDMRLNKAVQLIRGPKGTPVTLTIQPAGADASARRSVTLVRDEIRLVDEEAKAKVIELPDPHGNKLRLGVIDLLSFYASMDLTGPRNHSDKSTSVDVRRLLNKLEKENVNGVILDLRHNGGGSLEEAIRLTGLFIKEGPVVQVRNWDGSVDKDMDPDPGIVYDGPLIVLTDRLSASASEILAGALQDYSRALIVGDSSTHGKGTVQSLVPVNMYYTNIVHGPALATDPGDMKITIKKFYRPSGASTQRNGVVPDIILPSVLGESKEIGESTLENALEPDAVAGADFERLNRVTPYLADLRKRSSERLATDPEFAYIRQDIEIYKRLEADKTISLNEKQRLKQKEEDDARETAREKARAGRTPSPEVVHSLKLEDVDKPGLPPPVVKAKPASASDGQKASAGGVAQKTAVKGRGTGRLDRSQEGLEDDKPVVDPALSETEHILVDYVGAVQAANAVASHNANAATQ